MLIQQAMLMHQVLQSQAWIGEMECRARTETFTEELAFQSVKVWVEESSSLHLGRSQGLVLDLVLGSW